VLGVAFSFGMPMAFAAVLGTVPLQGWALLVVNAFWVLAYDTEYAMVDRDDDLRIGIKTSAITLGRFDVAAIAAFYALHLTGWSLMLWELAVPPIFLLGVAAATAQAAWHVALVRHRNRDGCFKAFRLNHWIGLSLFAGVVLAFA
jgi:4-hydroxybenzoate polyprenyltransferase